MANYSDRWAGIERPYGPDDVVQLRGSQPEQAPFADTVAKRLWHLLTTRDYTHAMGAVTGNQAMQMVKAGVPAIYCSGWQVAADANDSHEMYPDQSLYAVHSVPMLAQKINSALRRADQVEWSENDCQKIRDWFAPIIADAEAGFGGPLNAFELMKTMIRAGVAGVHFEDQLSSAKKCGHLGGKVLVPGSEFIRKLVAARLAADVMGTETLLIARTDANSARLLTSDIDEEDRRFILTCAEGEDVRTPEGFHRITGGLDMAISRGLRYAPYADLLWCETGKPDLDEAKRFADAIHEKFPGKLLAYNCSPSFNWKKKLDDATIAKFQRELGAMGYKFQFITLAGFHNLNYHMFKLAQDYESRDMTAYAELQQAEFASEADGYTATKHQREVGTGYFDLVAQTISSGGSSTLALEDSTEAEQF
jgi:isocitrate lyase